MEPERIKISIQTRGGDTEVRKESQSFGPIAADNLERWDNREKEKRESRKGNKLCEREKETKQELVRELFKRKSLT